MAHGGLRYLELFDFRQVFEGVKARDELFRTAPHLVHPYRFQIPIKKEEWWKRIKLGVGLKLYDLFLADQKRKHRWIPVDALTEDSPLSALPLSGCYQFWDGIMEDTRLVIEELLAFKAAGGMCLNHCEVERVDTENSESVLLTVKAADSEEGILLQARAVLNCAGPWAPFLRGEDPLLRYSRGVHLLFDRPWPHPALLLPLPERGRYYFVWPHREGTLVGTTEKEIPEPSGDPFPTGEELERILHRLKRDLPHAGFKREKIHYAFAGERSIPMLKPGKGSISNLSRGHHWIQDGKMATLLGGKYTTARWTAAEGLRLLSTQLPILRTFPEGGELPGAVQFERRCQRFTDAAREAHVPEKTIERVASLYGGRAARILEFERGLEQLPCRVLRGELEMVLEEEEPKTVEDLVRRRLMLEYQSGNGMEFVSSLETLLPSGQFGDNLLEQVEGYNERLGKLHELISSLSDA